MHCVCKHPIKTLNAILSQLGTIDLGELKSYFPLRLQAMTKLNTIVTAGFPGPCEQNAKHTSTYVELPQSLMLKTDATWDPATDDDGELMLGCCSCKQIHTLSEQVLSTQVSTPGFET